jgi:hypothetical protein
VRTVNIKVFSVLHSLEASEHLRQVEDVPDEGKTLAVWADVTLQAQAKGRICYYKGQDQAACMLQPMQVKAALRRFLG